MKKLLVCLAFVLFTLICHAADSFLLGTWQRAPQLIGHYNGGYAAIVIRSEPGSPFELAFTSSVYTNEIDRMTGTSFLVKETATKRFLTYIPDASIIAPFTLVFDKRDASFYTTVKYPATQTAKRFSRKIKGFFLPPELFD